MFANKLIATALVGIILGGCVGGPGGMNKQNMGMLGGAAAGGLLGSTIGKGTGNTAAIIGGAVLGGLIGGSIGAQLDAQDQAYYSQTTMAALNTGQPQSYRSQSGASWDVQPSQPQYVNNTVCREYTSRIYVGGKPQTMVGRACRNPDGTWSNAG